MTIITKYSIGDTVYYLSANEIKSFVIGSILMKVNHYSDFSVPKTTVKYSEDIYGNKVYWEEADLFGSLDEIVNFMKSQYLKNESSN